MNPAVEVRGLTRRFGRLTAVDHVDFKVPAGSIYGLLGLNGAGKTTSLRMITTLLKPTSGTARVMGHDVLEEPVAARRAIGVVAEDSGRARLDWRLPHYLEYFGALQGLTREEARARAEPLVKRLLPDHAHDAPLDTFSAGMRKKAEIIRALLSRPRVLLLDEPTKDLDIPAKRELWEYLKEAVEADGLTVLLTSHDALEIRNVCDEVCILHAGKVAYAGPLADLGSDAEALQHRLGELLQRGSTDSRAEAL